MEESGSSSEFRAEFRAKDFFTTKQVCRILDVTEGRLITLCRAGSVVSLAMGTELCFPKWQFVFSSRRNDSMKEYSYSSGISDVLVRLGYPDSMHFWDIEHVYMEARPATGESPTRVLSRARVRTL